MEDWKKDQVGGVWMLWKRVYRDIKEDQGGGIEVLVRKIGG